MQFEYCKNESVMYDRLQFPILVFLKPESETDSTYGISKEDIKNFTDKVHLEFIEEMQSKLETYETTIRQFYADEFMSDYDFFQLLIKAVPFFGYESVETYLAHVETLKDSELKRLLVKSLLNADRDILAPDDDTLKDDVLTLMNDRNALLSFIKNLPTEEAYRFNLLMMLEDPLNHLEAFKTLMMTLKPLFDEVYSRFEDDVKRCETVLETTLEENGEKGFDELTQGFVDKKFLNPGVNRYLISIIFPYSFMVKTSEAGGFIVSGTHMQEGFETLMNKHYFRLDNQTKVFKNFADKTRYEVLRKIASGISSTKQIAEDIGVSSATISYHINAFVTTGILVPSSEKTKKYDINFSKIEEAYHTLIKDLGGDV